MKEINTHETWRCTDIPSSFQLTVDRQTIARHLLSDQIDPFNRQPLTMEEVVPNTELKARITGWLEEKRTQRAAQAAQQAKEAAPQGSGVQSEPDDTPQEK